MEQSTNLNWCKRELWEQIITSIGNSIQDNWKTSMCYIIKDIKDTQKIEKEIDNHEDKENKVKIDSIKNSNIDLIKMTEINEELKQKIEKLSKEIHQKDHEIINLK